MNMKKLLIAFMLLFAPAAGAATLNGQYYNIAIGISQTGALVALPNATITVCSSASNCSGTVVSLCSGLNDALCSQPGVFNADSAGNFLFYALPGVYQVQVTKIGFTSYIIKDAIVLQSVVNPASLPANQTFTGTNTFNGTTIFNGPVVGITSSSVLPTAQIGDIIRFNVNGDSVWDAVNYASPSTIVYPIFGGPPTTTGPLTTGFATLGSFVSTNPTATLGVGAQYSAAAAGSTSTVIGLITGQNGNQSVMGMLAFYRWTHKFQMSTITSVRWWQGLGCLCTGGCTPTGNNGAAILNTTAYATDTPNKTTLGFRYSAGTDTHWQAVSANAGGSQTTTDTGITPDLNIHVYEMTTNATGTAVSFLIDGVQVAQITTNLPNPANGGNSFGDLFWTGDNKNTATAMTGTTYYMQISHK